MKKVTFTIRLRLNTDPSDPIQMEQDLSETLQEIIEAGEILDVAHIQDEDEEDEEDEEELY
jgi:hypothetical protein